MSTNEVDRGVFSWIHKGHRIERNQRHVPKSPPSYPGYHGPQPAIGYHLVHGTDPRHITERLTRSGH